MAADVQKAVKTLHPRNDSGLRARLYAHIVKRAHKLLDVLRCGGIRRDANGRQIADKMAHVGHIAGSGIGRKALLDLQVDGELPYRGLYVGYGTHIDSW